MQGWGTVCSLREERVSKSEAYRIEVDQYRPPTANCHPAILLPGVTWRVAVTDIDGF